MIQKGLFVPRRSKSPLLLLAGSNITGEINAFTFLWTLLLLLGKRFPLLESIKICESQTKTLLPPPTFCVRCLISVSWGHNHLWAGNRAWAEPFCSRGTSSGFLCLQWMKPFILTASDLCQKVHDWLEQQWFDREVLKLFKMWHC